MHILEYPSVDLFDLLSQYVVAVCLHSYFILAGSDGGKMEVGGAGAWAGVGTRGPT